jgi:hypothetical protein
LLEQLQPFGADSVFERGKSLTLPNTIGTVRLTCCKGTTVIAPPARMTSGASATNSCADLRMRS